MCGATAIKYYLPTVFLALGLSKDLSLMASGIESTLKIGCTIMEMLIIDKLGRKKTLLLGCAVMSLAMIVSLSYYPFIPCLNGALPLAYPKNKNHVSDYACIVFIFFFSFGYSIGFGPNAWVYGTEVCSSPQTTDRPLLRSCSRTTSKPPLTKSPQIFPTYIRAKGINIAASVGAIGSIVVGQFFPVGIQNIGSKTYFIFFAINAASMIIMTIWYPETKGKTLEEMDGLFGKLLNENDVEGHGGGGIAGGKRHDEGEKTVEQQAVEVDAGKR